MSRINRDRKYTLENNETRFLACLKGIRFSNAWLTIVDGEATIKKGYSWDGRTPKLKLFGKTIVNPNDDKDYIKQATLWNDVLLQFSNELNKLGLERKEIDLLFLKDLIGKAWSLSILYYRFVRMFGWITFD